MMRKRTVALTIFLVALASRILFWQATADRHWGWSVYFKGDAPLWLDYGRALDADHPFELGLPIRPPGAAWLVSLFWNGSPSGLAWLRLCWIVMGALIPLLVFLAAERQFGLRAGTVAGAFCAIAHGLLILSTTIDNETPYLLLATAAILLLPRDPNPSLGRTAGWSVVNAVACLFRAEHLIFFVLALAFSRKRVVASALFFAITLVPWHITAWESIRRFNEEPRRLSPMEERAVSGVEAAAAPMWTNEGRQRCAALPAFARRTLCAFVAATVMYRGGNRIGSEDFGVLEEAFGSIPKPLQRFPFVSNSGPLNFYLANNPRATGGFDRSPLEEPPPLRGIYPDALIQNLPPPQLTFFYPPHLHIFNDGYALGFRWIASHPADFAKLTARKLAIFWSGAALGVTGYNLPVGAGGLRRAVDMTVPASAPVWRGIVLILCAAGLVFGWRRPESWPWLLYAISRVAAAVLFFGYARHGATIIPVVAVLIALLTDRFAPRLSVRAIVAILVVAIAIETVRVATRPAVLIDGQSVGSTDPFPPDLHLDQHVDVR